MWRYSFLNIVCLMVVVSVNCLKFAQADIVIDGYSDATNDRFTDAPQFIARPFDLSGLGQTDGGSWATLIGADLVVSANHAPSLGNISFFANNNPNSTPVVRHVVMSSQIGNSDLWIGRLNAAVDSTITPFRYATTPLSGPSAPNATTISVVPAGIYQNNNVYMVGQSPALQPANRNQAFGRNRIAGFANDVQFFGGLTDSLIVTVESFGNPNFVQYEASLRVGDSGAPMLLASDNELILLGVNSFVLENAERTAIVGAGATYLGNYSGEIADFAANVTAIPEPVTGVYAALIVGLSWHLRRRNTLQKS